MIQIPRLNKRLPVSPAPTFHGNKAAVDREPITYNFTFSIYKC